jgi:hypothetical protein
MAPRMYWTISKKSLEGNRFDGEITPKNIGTNSCNESRVSDAILSSLSKQLASLKRRRLRRLYTEAVFLFRPRGFSTIACRRSAHFKMASSAGQSA